MYPNKRLMKHLY